MIIISEWNGFVKQNLYKKLYITFCLYFILSFSTEISVMEKTFSHLRNSTWCKRCWTKRQKLSLSVRENSSQPRRNPVNIQMLTDTLHKQIYGSGSKSQICSENLKIIQSHLEKHGLANKTTSALSDIDLKLPKLLGENIEDHFFAIAQDQIRDYLVLIEDLIKAPLPTLPSTWQFKKGWTKYFQDGTFDIVPFPDERSLVFDIESLMGEGHYPTMATAVSSKHWYFFPFFF